MSTWPDPLSPAAAWDLVHFIGSRSPKYLKNRARSPTPIGKGAL
jgi:hypothetical protein